MLALLERTEARTLYLILGSLLLVVTTALSSFLVWPQIQSYQSTLASRDMLRGLVAGGDDLQQQLQQEQQDVDALHRQLHGDTANLPVKQMESYVIARLQKICWQTDMELISVKPGKGQKVQMFREVKFAVEMAGGYYQFFAWLRAVGEELGFVVIKEYEILPMGEEREDPRLMVRLTLVSYRVWQS